MKVHAMKANVVKDGVDITRLCEITREAEIEDEAAFPGVKRFRLFYFNKVSLLPIFVFQHMGGTGLIRWFEGSTLRMEDGSEVDGLHYVHGRSEVLKGTPNITAVLLAKAEYTHDVPYDRFITYLPEIYRRFSLMK